jgi:hypothetical protein
MVWIDERRLLHIRLWIQIGSLINLSRRNKVWAIKTKIG